MINSRNKPFRSLAGIMTMIFALLAGFVAVAAEPTGGGRWLLIFDTSSTMKKFQLGTEAALKNFLATSADGQMQAGDSVGVWAVNQQINGQYPTFTWVPDEASEVFTNLTGFLRHQRFAAPSQLASMASSLNYVNSNSRRVTVVLFTDGQSGMAGTAYDDGINQMFLDSRLERARKLQPIIVVVRGQLGQFIGCTVNFPPGPVNLPPFPPPPAPPAVVMPVTNPVTAAVTSLVIVGKSVSTNLQDTPPPPPVAQTQVSTPPTPKPVVIVTNPPLPDLTATQVIVAAKNLQTNPAVSAAPKNPPAPPSNTLVAVAVPAAVPPAAVPVSPAPTNPLPVIAAPTAGKISNLGWVGIGAGAVVLLLLLIGVAVFRIRHSKQSSLITTSMHDNQRRR